MTVRTQIWRLFAQEDINFLLTNRIPRRLATQFVGWLSQVEQPLVRDLSIGLWRLFSRSRSQRSQENAFPQHARLLHPRAQGRCAPDRPDGRHPGQPVRRHRRRLRRHRRHAPLPGQGLSLHAGRSAVRPRSGRGVSQRPLCDAAPDCRHVSPLPRAARLPRRAGDLRLRRHLERQSDRAQTNRAAVLQERTRRAAHDALRQPATA